MTTPFNRTLLALAAASLALFPAVARADLATQHGTFKVAVKGDIVDTIYLNQTNVAVNFVATLCITEPGDGTVGISSISGTSFVGIPMSSSCETFSASINPGDGIWLGQIKNANAGSNPAPTEGTYQISVQLALPSPASSNPNSPTQLP